MKPGSWFRWAWLTWAVVLVVSLTVIEWLALAGKRHPRDTLSANVQWLVRHNRNFLVRWGTAAAWLVFAGWFLHHIWID
jgi:hypothetical protein